MIGEELTNRAEILYNNDKKAVIDNSYRFVSKVFNKKTAKLLDKFQLGLINKTFEKKDLSDLLQLNNYFKEKAIQTPEKLIISNDFYKVSDFHMILHKYNK